MRILLVISFAFCSSFLFAQEKADTLSRKEKKILKKQLKKQQFLENNDAYRIAGLMVSQTQFQDTRMSPLIFAGGGAALDLKYLRFGNKYMKQRQFRLQYHLLGVDELEDAYMHSLKMDFAYSLKRKLNFPLGKFYLGANINNQFSPRIYSPLGNNALAMDNSLSFSPGFFWLLEKTYRKRTCYLSVQGGFNLLNLVIRYPYFTYGGTELQLSSLNRYQRIFLEITAAPRLKNSQENHWSISYVFDAYSLSSPIDEKGVANYFNGIKFSYWLKTK